MLLITPHLDIIFVWKKNNKTEDKRETNKKVVSVSDGGGVN